MSAESLQAACELAYVVAREDAESAFPAEPPSSMRSFLYVSDLPRRAITVAQQAIESDSEFRNRVAGKATEENVGRAGYLWLHRPPGWASEFDLLTTVDDDAEVFSEPMVEPLSTGPEPDPELEEVYANLTGNADMIDAPLDTFAGQADPDAAFSPESPPIADVQMATVSPISGFDDPLPVPPPPTYESTALGAAALAEQPDYEAVETNFTAIGETEGAMLESTESDFEADALEDELSSLRGLVDRLAGERDQVLSGVGSATAEETAAVLGERVLEGELRALESDLESAKHELLLAKDDLAVARSEREEAQRLHSETLKRQVELEKELAVIREERMDIESQAMGSQAQTISLEDKLTRVSTQLEEADRERNVIKSQLETMTTERNHIRDDRATIRSERDDLSARLAEVDEVTGGANLSELVSTKAQVETELETTSRELTRMTAQAEGFEEQIKHVSVVADSLKAEKIELTSRLADTEIALETTSTQHDALKSDSERLAAEVGTLRAERDSLQTQLTELQASLAEVLDEQAEIRKRNDGDRRDLNELRVERDVLMARMSDLEQAEKDYEVKIRGLVSERDDLVTARDDLINERTQVRNEAAGFAGERDQTIERLNEVQSKIGPLEVELQAERRQREELATRLLELDDIAEQNSTELARLTSEREQLATAYQALEAQQLDAEALKTERDSLVTRVDEADRRLDDVETQNGQKLAEVSEQLTAAESARSAAEQRLNDTLLELETTKREASESSTGLAQTSAKLEEAERAAQVAEAARMEELSRASAAASRADAAEAALAAEVARSTDLASQSPGVTDLAQPTAFVDTSLPPSLIDDVADHAADVADEVSEDDSGDPDAPATLAAAPPSLLTPDIEDLLTDPETETGADPDPKVDEAPFGVVPDVASNPFGTDTMSELATSVPGADLADLGSDDFDWPSATGTDPVAVTDTDDLLPGDDDLDEVSALISATVSGFSEDPAVPSPAIDESLLTDEISAEDAPASAPADSTQVLPSPTAPPSIFGASAEEDVAPAGGQPGSRRRQIQIPADIMDDEVAVAQFVVSSPDVVLLVDGDAVAKLGWPSLLVAEQRDALVTYLADLSASSGAAPDVVFDGRIGDDESLPASRAVRIRLSTPPTEPAAALDELVDAYPDQWPIALVTDDEDLGSAATERGAAVLNNGQLLDLFIAQ